MNQSKKNECIICSEFFYGEADKVYLTELYEYCGIKNRVLYEDEQFIVIPSLGPVSDCHLLVIPKCHVTSFAMLDAESFNNAEKIITKISHIVRTKFGNCIVFEHGTLNDEMKSSASCNHAHMHIVSCNQSILPMLKRDGLQLRRITQMSQIAEQKERGKPYFYYCENNDFAYLMDDTIQKSQYMRILISDVLGTPERGDWKKNYGISEMGAMFFDMKSMLETIHLKGSEWMKAKLVRDNIPQIIERQGKRCSFRVLEEEEYHIMLIKKLQEEVQEFIESESIDELADVLEVVTAIMKEVGFSEKELYRAMDDKAKVCGKFKKRILMEGIT